MSEPNSHIRSHRDLIIWQKSVRFVITVYESTKSFPKEERYGLTSQTRRAAVSIPANIAEGHGRRHSREYSQFLGISRGSLCELDTHLEIAFQLGYLTELQYLALKEGLAEIGKMLNSLIRCIK